MGKHKKRNKRNKRRNKRRTHRKKVVHKKSKGFSSYTREFIHSRADGKCQFPECNDVGEQCHHIQKKSVVINYYHWSEAKTNDPSNGILLCRKHHIYVHEFERWREYIKYFQGLNANRE